MNYMNTWNAVVKHFKANIDKKEPDIQKLWEIILSELFGYSKLLGLLISQEHLDVGSNGSLIPDIILRKDNSPVCAIELKQETITLNKKIEKQLFSYLKQAKLSVGVIVADKLYLYSYKYEKDDNEQLSVVIPFEENNLDGAMFVELMNRESFDKKSIFEFVNAKNLFYQHIDEIKNTLDSELIKKAVIQFLSNNYTQEELALALESTEFSCSIPTAKKAKKHNNVSSEQVVVKTSANSDIDSNVVISGGLNAKKYLKNYFIKKGIIDSTWDFNIASLNKNNRFYWANPRVDCITKNWCLVLNNALERKLYVFKIPANSISKEQIVTRMHHHKDLALQITIVQKDKKFVCSTSKIDYSDWLVQALDY